MPSYILIMRNQMDRTLRVGKNLMINFKSGYYYYVGSAKRISRVKRHFQMNKNLRWHIDYISTVFDVVGAVILEFEECELAKILSKHLKGVKGFGCSDCRCETHLFYSENLTLEFLPI